MPRYKLTIEREIMKKSFKAVLTISYSLFLAAVACIFTLGSNYTAEAAAYSDSSDKPVIQYDRSDIAPPPVPDNPEAPGPGDIQDDALSPDSVISDPDPPIDQTEHYIMEPGDEEPQPEEEPEEYYPDAIDPEYYTDQQNLNAEDTSTLVDEEDPLVNQNDPLVEHPYPLVSQPGALVDQPSPLVDQPRALVDQPTPLVNQPQPLVRQPAPLVKQPQPLVKEPPAVVNHPEPLVNMPSPLVGQPSPLVNRSSNIAR
jgi:hypothetical protein